MSRLKDPEAIRKIAKKSLFEGLDHLCEGAIIVDREARIVWLSDKYAARLGLADIHLHKRFNLPSDLVESPGERGHQARPVERMDAIEQAHGVFRLVGLQLSDEMQCRIGKPFAQSGPLGLRLLHPVLAERALAGCEQRLDRLGGVRLADRDQRHVFRIAARDLAGVGDAMVDFFEAQGCIHGGCAL